MRPPFLIKRFVIDRTALAGKLGRTAHGKHDSSVADALTYQNEATGPVPVYEYGDLPY